MAQLVMKRPDGAVLDADGPIRVASNDDAAGLARLLAAAFPEMSWTIERVHADLLDAADVATTFVVEQDGAIVATASVRYTDRFPEDGYVHWVGVDPAHRGKGLSDLVMAAVLNRFLADGRASAILETDDVRMPAIGSYLRLGFVPQYTEPDHAVRWSRIFMAISAFRRTGKVAS